MNGLAPKNNCPVFEGGTGAGMKVDSEMNGQWPAASYHHQKAGKNGRFGPDLPNFHQRLSKQTNKHLIDEF
jgi:hypothetical protein